MLETIVITPEVKVVPPTASACLVCGTPLKETPRHYFDTRFGHPDLYSISACAQCGLEQTLPRPSSDDLRKLYETYYNFGGEKGTSYTGWRERFLKSSFYRLWLKLDGDISFHAVKGKGRLLDFGCNEGRGLPLYQANGFETEGLEFNQRAAAQARDRGFQIYTCSLEDLPTGVTYDVIVLSNVLEHALDPLAMLRSCYARLNPGGQVWISCPNSRSLWRSLLGNQWINWHVPFHLTHFTEDNLQELMRCAGFTSMKKSQATPSLWVAQSFVSRWFARRGQPTIALRRAPLIAAMMLLMRGLGFPILFFSNRLGRGDCLIIQGTRQ